MFGKVNPLSYSCGSGKSCGDMCLTYCEEELHEARESKNNQGDTGQQAATKNEHSK